MNRNENLSLSQKYCAAALGLVTLAVAAPLIVAGISVATGFGAGLSMGAAYLAMFTPSAVLAVGGLLCLGKSDHHKPMGFS